MIERQELFCHACNNYVQFNLDLEIDGNHVLKCPSCGHEHCRVVKNGQITAERWDSRNVPTITVPISTITWSVQSYTGTFDTSCTFTVSAWYSTAGYVAYA